MLEEFLDPFLKWFIFPVFSVAGEFQCHQNRGAALPQNGFELLRQLVADDKFL